MQTSEKAAAPAIMVFCESGIQNGLTRNASPNQMTAVKSLKVVANFEPKNVRPTKEIF